MKEQLRVDANQIIDSAIKTVCPDEAVRRALKDIELSGHVYIVATGKAGWQMAKAAVDYLKETKQSYDKGVVITKYDHVMGELDGIECFEAGHPIPDENSFIGTRAALDLTKNLKSEDTVLFLLSGGGSALFEEPLVSPEELQSITSQLLASGANIVEMNTIRKRLSNVKGGNFALHCNPAKVHSIILSDIIGDPLGMIASGPTVADETTSQDAIKILKKYNIKVTLEMETLLRIETPKQVDNANNLVIGSVRELCKAAAYHCEELGYETVFLTDCLEGEAREVGKMLGAIAKSHAKDGVKRCYIAGGETIVYLKGNGLGGRNQEIAFAAMREIEGLDNVAVFSVGSDGTDGPTDAAGGFVDGDSLKKLNDVGLKFDDVLDDNDCYHGLKAIDGLVITGPTGTNVNDFCVALINNNGRVVDK